MTAPTTQRPPALSNPTGGKPAQLKTPPGAAKLAKMFVNDKGLPQKSPTPVPVDENDRRTAHVIRQCPHLSVVNGGGKERCTVDRDWFLPSDPDMFCRAHGKRLEPVDDGPSKLELTLRAAREMHGRSALPWLIPAGMAATDLALHLEAIGGEAVLSVPVLAGIGYLSAKRTLTSRAIKRNRIEKGEKSGRRYARIAQEARRYAALAAEAGIWTAALAATDVTHPAGALIAAAGMGRWAYACTDWWKSADRRRVDAANLKVDANAARTTQPEIQPVNPAELRALTTWKTIIGSAGGPLPDTELRDFERLPNCQAASTDRTLLPNWTAKVVAKMHGSVNMRENRPSLLGRIAAAYGVSYADVSFAADEHDLSVATLRVQPDNPLAEIRMWTGPQAANWSTGTSIAGRFDDGRPMYYQWFDEGGACHDVFGGSSGSGKSELITLLLLTSLHSGGLVLDWVGDSQSGQSFGALKEHVDWFARGKSEIEFMLLAAVKEMYRRNDELAQQNIKTWRPSLEMPLLVITLDEVQSYLGDAGVVNELVTLLAGMGRKCGIKLRLCTQIIAAYNLGGDTYIKDQAKTGQTFTFRSETDQAARSAIEGDSPIDPTALPRKWGRYTCAAGKKTAGLVFVQGVHGRDVYGRTDYTGEKLEPWLLDAEGRLTLTPGRFCDAAQQVSGVLWGDRIERARKLLEAGRDDADLLPGGKALDLIEAASATADPSVAKRPEGAAPVQERARDSVFTVAMEIAEESGTVTRPALSAAVKGRMASGTLDKAISDLVEDGFLVRVKNGVYAVPGGGNGEDSR